MTGFCHVVPYPTHAALYVTSGTSTVRIAAVLRRRRTHIDQHDGMSTLYSSAGASSSAAAAAASAASAAAAFAAASAAFAAAASRLAFATMRPLPLFVKPLSRSA